MKLGIDLDGTKIEIIALDNQGIELLRRRVATPQGDYPATLHAIENLVHAAEAELGQRKNQWNQWNQWGQTRLILIVAVTSNRSDRNIQFLYR